MDASERLSYGLRYRLPAAANVATVPVGYADGVRRNLSNVADVLIGGRRRRIIGSITMDQLMVDCGDDPVQRGDDVVLIGRQGDERITRRGVGGAPRHDRVRDHVRHHDRVPPALSARS